MVASMYDIGFSGEATHNVEDRVPSQASVVLPTQEELGDAGMGKDWESATAEMMPHLLLGKYVLAHAVVVETSVPIIHVIKMQEIKSQAEYHYRILEVGPTINALTLTSEFHSQSLPWSR